MDGITPIPAAVIAALVIAMGVVSLLFAYRLEAARCPKGEHVRLRPARIAPGTALIAIGAVFGIWLGVTMAIAYDHGMYDPNVPLAEITASNTNSFPDQSEEWHGPRDMAGAVVVMYRYGCEDCEATAHPIEAALSADGVRHLWMSSRSEKGYAIRDSYNVNEVPSYVAFSPDGAVMTKVAYRTNENDDPVMDIQAYEEVRRFAKGER